MRIVRRVARNGAFRRSSLLGAPAERVWERISTPDGVNDEFKPFLRMTFPPEVRSLDPDTVPIGSRICRSWVLLFGLLPVDYDDLVLVSVDPPHGFHERSSMLTQRTWEHERTLEPLGDDACRVTDRLTFEPRLGLPPLLFAPVLRLAFRWRHIRLRKAFGVSQATLLYDADCGFCRWSLERVLAWDRRGRLRPLALDSAEARELTPGMSDEQRAASWHLVEADGTVASGGAAFAPLGRLLPGGALLGAVPRGVADRGYRFVASRRGRLGNLVAGRRSRR